MKIRTKLVADMEEGGAVRAACNSMGWDQKDSQRRRDWLNADITA